MNTRDSSNNRNSTRISKSFWEACGRPKLDDPLFVRCLYIGYGPAAIRVAMVGLDSSSNDVFLTAEYMGFNEIDYKVIME
jgi:hypothetical protein